MTARPLVAVLVLGPLARSPRMLAHARELARHAHPVVLIGYGPPPPDLPQGVRAYCLDPGERTAESAGPLHFLRSAWQRMSGLGHALWRALEHLRPTFLLAQTPPAFPTILVAGIWARTHGASFLLDWHNFGYTLLALRLRGSLLGALTVPLARLYELLVGPLAHHHFTVSRAMAHRLAKSGIRAAVLPDLPLSWHPSAAPASPPLRVVYPSGWTRDEDIPLVLEAVRLLSPGLIDLHLTGDGPLFPALSPAIAALQSLGHSLHTGYLPTPEYQALLASSHLGLSAHRSSSGVDLPIKVIDLQSAGLPVLALDYGPVVHEQIHPGRNGLLFQTAPELASILLHLAQDPEQLVALRPAPPQELWPDAWLRVVGQCVRLTAA